MFWHRLAYPKTQFPCLPGCSLLYWSGAVYHFGKWFPRGKTTHGTCLVIHHPPASVVTCPENLRAEAHISLSSRVVTSKHLHFEMYTILLKLPFLFLKNKNLESPSKFCTNIVFWWPLFGRSKESGRKNHPKLIFKNSFHLTLPQGRIGWEVYKTIEYLEGRKTSTITLPHLHLSEIFELPPHHTLATGEKPMLNFPVKS